MALGRRTVVGVSLREPSSSAVHQKANPKVGKPVFVSWTAASDDLARESVPSRETIPISFA
jgi:hypothetical protein